MKRYKEKVGLFYMMKRIYPIFFRASPGYYIFNQGAVLLQGLCCAAIMPISQFFFDSVYDVASGSSKINIVILSFLLFIGIKLLSNILDSVVNYSYNVQYMRVWGYMNRLINKKSSQIDPIEYENPSCLDDIDKCFSGANSAISFFLVTSVFFSFDIPWLAFTIWYLGNIKSILLLCLLLAFVPVMVSHILQSTFFSNLEDTVAPYRRKCTAYAEACSGKDYYKETKILGAFGFLKELLSSTIELLNAETWKTQKRSSCVNLVSSGVSFCCYGGILFLLTDYLIAGDISVGAFAAVFSSIDTLFSLMKAVFGTSLGELSKSYGQICNFLGFLDMETDNREVCEFDKEKCIVATNVDFAYPNAKYLTLKNINLTIKPGETVAIVGENGSGKTTLVKILTGLYKPDNGSVKIGQTDLSMVSYASAFRDISIVCQKYQRYSLTLRENIQLADFDKIDDERVEEVLKDNRIDWKDTTLFPDGLNTILSREFGGVELSGGQWQRIAIARGFYRDSRIIVLDEPTAAIDPIEESMLYQKFSEMAKGKTALIVTHRLGSTKKADRILVMQKGEIVESGTHNELMERANGIYANMYLSQAKWYQAES